MKVKVELTLDVKPDSWVGAAAIKAEIRDAVMNWGGARFPGDSEYDPDPLFYPFRKVTFGPMRVVE